MIKQVKKCILLLLFIMICSGINVTNVEAAVWGNANYYVQTINKTSLYKKDLTSSKYRAESLKKGKKIKILKISKYGWGMLKYNNKTRYIQMYKTAPYWTKIDQDKEVSTASSIYSQNSTASKYKVKTLSKGTVVHVVKKSSDGWSRILYGGKTRYIKTKYLIAISKKTTSTSTTPALSYAFTIGSTTHSTITVTDTKGNVIQNGSSVKAGTKLKATISVSSGYQFQHFEGVSSATTMSTSFTMPNHECGIGALITCSNAGKYTGTFADYQMQVIYAIVAQEAGPDQEGQAAVMTSVMNRLASPLWKNYGTNPFKQITAKGQYANVFESDGKTIKAVYQTKIKTCKPEAAVEKVLNGYRNHDCCSFRTGTSYYKGLYPFGTDIGGNWFFNLNW